MHEPYTSNTHCIRFRIHASNFSDVENESEEEEEEAEEDEEEEEEEEEEEGVPNVAQTSRIAFTIFSLIPFSS